MHLPSFSEEREDAQLGEARRRSIFVDYENRRLPEPWQPPRRRPRLTSGQQKAMVWIVGFNVVMLLFGPLAGTTLLQALWVSLTR